MFYISSSCKSKHNGSFYTLGFGYIYKKDFLLIQRKLGSKIPLVKEDRILNYSQGSNWNVQDAEVSYHRRTKPPKSFRNLPLFHPACGEKNEKNSYPTKPE